MEMKYFCAYLTLIVTNPKIVSSGPQDSVSVNSIDSIVHTRGRTSQKNEEECYIFFSPVPVDLSDPVRWRYPLTTLQWQWWNSLPGFPTQAYYGPEQARRHLGAETGAPRCTRREYRTLTSRERTTLSEAFSALRSSRPDPASPHTEYDVFVLVHNLRRSPGAHFGPAFLLWHREFLFRMERALQRHEPTVCLPYWASPLDQALGAPEDSALWTDAYLGNSHGRVTSGLGANWTITPECRHVAGAWHTRDVNNDGCGRFDLYSREDVEYVLARQNYADITFEVDPKFENDHGRTHKFVGGYLSDVGCSPAAAEFWLHHAFIDYVLDGVLRRDALREYPPTQAPYQASSDPMMPFLGLLNVHGLSTLYTDYFYTYAPMPDRCSAEESSPCGGSDILWCDVTHPGQGRCVAKVREGSRCAGLPARACSCPAGLTPACDAGVCHCTEGDEEGTGVAAAIAASLRDIIQRSEGTRVHARRGAGHAGAT